MIGCVKYCSFLYCISNQTFFQDSEVVTTFLRFSLLPANRLGLFIFSVSPGEHWQKVIQNVELSRE